MNSCEVQTPVSVCAHVLALSRCPSRAHPQSVFSQLKVFPPTAALNRL